MKVCVWVFITIIVLVLLVRYVIYLYDLHERVCRLERKASPRLEIIEREIHGMGCYIRIIAGLAIFFCVSVCIHYVAVFYPRFTNKLENGRYVENLGMDYWGIIVGFFALLVTLLVGWQIYSTVKVKDEAQKMQDTFDKQYGDKVKNLDAKLFSLSLRNGNTVDNLNIGSYIELLGMILHKPGNHCKQLKSDILSILRGYMTVGEITNCTEEQYKYYAQVIKSLKDTKLNNYVQNFVVINGNERMTKVDRQKIFDDAEPLIKE